MVGLGILLGLGLLLGAIFGWVGVIQYSKLANKHRALDAKVRALESQINQFKNRSDTAETHQSREAEKSASAFEPQPQTPMSQTQDYATTWGRAQQAARESTPQPKAEQPAANTTAEPELGRGYIAEMSDKIADSLRTHWMVWLGGLCIALAGVFLARYAIDQGMLGPNARIAAGIAVGLALHFAAEYLRRKSGQTHPALAALAGGGSITLFAVLLAALHFYQLFSPMLIFVALALVACSTMWLARIHGPVLAIIGILGAYAVPILVSTGDGNMLLALVYVSLISVSALMLLRYVFRIWLLAGVVFGALGWWFLSLFSSQVEGWQGLYLALFAYCLLSIYRGDFGLRYSVELFTGSTPLRFWHVDDAMEKLLPAACLLIAMAQGFSLLVHGLDADNWWVGLPLLCVFLRAAQYRQNLLCLPWALTLLQAMALLGGQLNESGAVLELIVLDTQNLAQLLWLLLSYTLINLVVAVRQRDYSIYPQWWASLAALTPVISAVILYLLAPSILSSLHWVLVLLVVGACQMFAGHLMTNKTWPQAWPAWGFIAGHFYYSLAAVILLDRGGLTLALAAQAISIAWIYRRYLMPEMAWLLKACLAIVVVRLTLNPWLGAYPVNEHWTLWTYGGSLLCGLASWRLLQKNSSLACWAEASCLHLFALFVWVELRYLLNDGDVFASHFGFVETALNTSVFAALALVYNYRAQVSETLGKLYIFYSRALLLLAAASYAAILLKILDSDPWATTAVSSTPVFNLLLLALGAPVLMAYLVGRYMAEFRRIARYGAAIAGFIFLSMEIRHLWQGSIRLDRAAIDAEIYSYSLAWFLFAVAAIVISAWRSSKSGYQLGMWLLGAVILKVFLIDMSQLEGVYRIISFMGLGLGLLALSYLHQQLKSRLLA